MEEECSPTSSNITPDIEFIKHSTLSLVCLLLSASPAVGSAEMVEERFCILIFMFTVQYPIIPVCIEAAIYQCYPKYKPFVPYVLDSNCGLLLLCAESSSPSDRRRRFTKE